MVTPLTTYKATLRGNRLEWEGDMSKYINPERPVRVYVTVLEETEEPATRGQKMAQVLAQLAAINALQEIDNPAQWQREIRKDRPLPGRDEPFPGIG
jgi:hypothetical protein